MTVRSLWGDLPTGSEIKPPVTILHEQASILGDQTNNILVGKVIPEPTPTARYTGTGESFRYSLYISAPALNNYLYQVLEIAHTLDFYPVKLISNSTKEEVTCQDEQQFIEVLHAILSSPEVRRVASSLISQSRAIA